MRLGQLARKLSIRPSAIVDYLATQNLASDEGTNTKLSDDITRSIISHFNPSAMELIMESAPLVESVEPSLQPVEEVEVKMESDEPESIEDLQLEVKNTEESLESTISEEEISSPIEEVSVIKAPKVSLAGLKVLGKIELPEPKKKETEETIEQPESAKLDVPREQSKNFRQRRKSPFQDDRKKRKSTVNPIALQREKEAREAEEKRSEQIKREKEIRTLRYYQRVKPSAPTKPARIYDEPLLEMKDHKQKKEPTTWWGRFWRWYTT